MSAAAETFGRRPSELVGLDDAVLALDFDLAAAARLFRAKARAAEAARNAAESVAPSVASEVDW